MVIRNTTRQRGGFSLVEMLTVIAIIALLIAILVPAIGEVRKYAKSTQSKATIGALETGIQTYYGDGRVGGGYPYSMPYDNKQLPVPVKNPYKNMGSGAGISGDTFYITGAGLLTWALVGADRLGAPGFIQTRSTSQGWWEDTDTIASPSAATPDPTKSGAYAIYAKNAYSASNQGQPIFPRSGPFVDMSKVKLSEWDPKAQCTAYPSGSATGSFTIPLEADVSKDLGLTTGPPQRKYPMFLDGFGGPVLYFRADPAGQAMTSLVPNQVSNVSVQARSTYYFRDNSPLVDPSVGNVSGTESVLRTVLTASATPHRLRLDSNETLPGQASKLLGGWDTYIVDKSITARFVSQRADSYLLITAGPDGIFGTADDITNFNANGADCARTARTN